MRKVFWLDETHETTNGFEVNIVTENESGYLPSALIVPTNDVNHAKAVVALLNEQLFNIAPADANMIVLSSMFPRS